MECINNINADIEESVVEMSHKIKKSQSFKIYKFNKQNQILLQKL